VPNTPSVTRILADEKPSGSNAFGVSRPRIASPERTSIRGTAPVVSPIESMGQATRFLGHDPLPRMTLSRAS
jgi:hypothetical protein